MKLFRKLMFLGLCAIMGFMAVAGPSKSDDYIRHQVVRLYSDEGSCSGEFVRAPSGKTYILTAGHCRLLIHEGVIKVRDEDGRESEQPVLDQDSQSDLMLLSAPNNHPGLDLAQESHRFEDVRSFTHGSNLDTFETRGQIVQERDIDGVPEVADAPQTITTAWIVPGSSGGPVVDPSGDLIGVVSVSAGPFSGLVRLVDIKRFLARR